MPQTCWAAAPDGTNWLDVNVAGVETVAMIDTGFVDRFQRIGLSLEPQLYDQLMASGKLSGIITDYRLDAGGHSTTRRSGIVSAFLFDPVNRSPVGPTAQLYASRGAPGIPTRIGLVFFHQLTGCRVYWDLDRRLWCVEHP